MTFLFILYTLILLRLKKVIIRHQSAHGLSFGSQRGCQQPAGMFKVHVRQCSLSSQSQVPISVERGSGIIHFLYPHVTSAGQHSLLQAFMLMVGCQWVML